MPADTNNTPDVETQRQLNGLRQGQLELRQELLDHRHVFLNSTARSITWWMTLFSLFVAGMIAVLTFFGIDKFDDLETEIRNKFQGLEDDARARLEQLEGFRKRGAEVVQRLEENLTSESLKDPEEAKRIEEIIEEVSQDPEAILSDRAVANALTLQQTGRIDEAIERWRSISNVAEGIDNNLAARAWLSIGYLLQTGRTDKDIQRTAQQAISAYNEAIRLRPDYVAAYNNRGITKQVVGHINDAIADYNEAIRLRPDYDAPYSNRGNAKAGLGQYEAAIADHNEAIRLNSDEGLLYFNRSTVWLLQKEWDKARSDLLDAKNRGLNVIATFQSEFKSVADFEKQHGVKMPEGIKAIVEPQQDR